MDGGKIIWKRAKYLGVKTNNEAEYAALLCLLDGARERAVSGIEIRGDSKLVINQINKKWKINFPHLRALAFRVWELMDGMDVHLVWVPREENAVADALSNEAIDGHGDQSEIV
jgi:ribonuclease HI